MMAFPDAIFEELEMINEFTDKQLEEIAFRLKETNYPIEKAEREKICSELAKKFNIPEFKVNYIFRFSYFIINQLEDNKIFYETLKHDIKKEESLDDASKKKLVNYFNNLMDSKEYFLRKMISEYKTKGLTFIEDISFACDLRARFESEFIYEKENIENYIPKLHDFIPVMILRFELNDGEDTKIVSFQIDENNLNKLIAVLLAGQKQLKVSKENIR